ncbi:MAG: hypothetical protein RLZZ618_2609 [Pseudomonadota bacterium]
MRHSERLLKAVLWGWLLCLLCLAPAARALPQSLQANASSVDSAGHLFAWQEASPSPVPTNPNEVFTQAPWRPLPGAVGEGYLRGALWLRWEVQPGPEPARDWRLVFSNPLIDEVLVYRRDAAGIWRLVAQGGETVPRAEWPIQVPRYVLPIRFEPGQAETLLLRLRSKNSMFTTVTLQARDTFEELERSEARFYGFYFGGCLLLVLLHLLTWRMTHDQHGAWYFAYLFTNLGVEALTPGQAQFLMNLPMALSDPLLGLVICAHVGVGLCFSFRLLETRPRWAGWTRRAERAVWAILFVAAGLILMGRYGAGVSLAQAVGLVCLVSMQLLAVRLAWTGQSSARFFLMAFGVYLAAGGIIVMRNQGLIAPSFLALHASAIGSAIFMLMMSGRMKLRYDEIRRDKDQAQHELAHAVKAHNAHLTGEVAQRTATLVKEVEHRTLLELELRAALDNERRMREEQLDFVAMVAHEFRTPLAIIKTSAQQIARNMKAPPERTMERTQNIREASDRLVALVDDYLSADRLVADTAAFSPMVTPLLPLLRDIASEWLDTADSVDGNGNSVQWQVAEGLPEALFCDAGLLKVAVRNLINNAHRHRAADSVVHVAVSCQAGELDLCVCNQGQAIPADEIPHLFRKYFRGRQAQRSPGAGIGLYLVRRIAEMHGGKVQLDNAVEAGEVRLRLTVSLMSTSN